MVQQHCLSIDKYPGNKLFKIIRSTVAIIHPIINKAKTEKLKHISIIYFDLKLLNVIILLFFLDTTLYLRIVNI